MDIKIKIDRKSVIACLFFSLLVIANSTIADRCGIISACEGIAYLFLFTIILLRIHGKKVYLIHHFFIVFVLFSVGLGLQNMNFATKVKLLFTMWTIGFIVYMGGRVFNRIEVFRSTAYAILFISIMIMVLSVVLGINMIGISEDYASNYSSIAFNGGIVVKNFFASTMLSSFIGIYIFRVYGKKYKRDFITLIILLTFIMLSGSRGTWVLLAFFILIANSLKIAQICKDKRIRHILIGMLICFLLYMFYVFYNNYVVNSYTYSLRLKGFLNYWNLVKDNLYYLFFGYADHMYVSGIDYNIMFKTIFGKDSSTEIAYLNILIKSGLCGMIGFVIIFIDYFKQIKVLDEKTKNIGLAILFSLTLSGFVETYLVSIHLVYGVYCYFILSGLCEMNKLNNKAMEE